MLEDFKVYMQEQLVRKANQKEVIEVFKLKTYSLITVLLSLSRLWRKSARGGLHLERTSILSLMNRQQSLKKSQEK